MHIYNIDAKAWYNWIVKVNIKVDKKKRKKFKIISIQLFPFHFFPPPSYYTRHFFTIICIQSRINTSFPIISSFPIILTIVNPINHNNRNDDQDIYGYKLSFTYRLIVPFWQRAAKSNSNGWASCRILITAI